MMKTSGIAITTIHAPWANLVTSTITSTRAVVAAPSALIARARRIRPRSCGLNLRAISESQCRTIPAWLRVNETKTPMMYSWISRVVLASKAQISAMARTARITMPLEKTSLSPRLANCRGRNPSWPRIEARIGKPLKAVLAARTRIAAVKACTA